MNAMQRVKAVQREIAKAGFFSAAWHDGQTLHFIASTDPHWVDEHMHAAADTTGAMVIHWEPAAEQPKDDPA